MKIISEALAKWQLERLEGLSASLRSRAKTAQLSRKAIAWEHIDLVDDAIDEAVSALKYRKFEQASAACQEGFVQAGLAELLLRYGQKMDVKMNQLFLLSEKGKKSEGEEMVSFLASSLAQMKIAIEYSNCTVSKRVQAMLDHSMDFYNTALDAIKNSEQESANYAAQAGLLQIHLAGEFIAAENQISLPGWRGLSNPNLGSPLRRAAPLITLLVETKLALRQVEKEAIESKKGTENLLELKSDWEKAYFQFSGAMSSLAAGSVAHAQALIKSAIEDCSNCQEAVGLHSDISIQEEDIPASEDHLERIPIADVMTILGEVSDLLSSADLKKKIAMSGKIRAIGEKYSEAHKMYNAGKYGRAEKLASEALFEMDLLRDQFRRVTRRRSTKAEIKPIPGEFPEPSP